MAQRTIDSYMTDLEEVMENTSKWRDLPRGALRDREKLIHFQILAIYEAMDKGSTERAKVARRKARAARQVTEADVPLWEV